MREKAMKRRWFQMAVAGLAVATSTAAFAQTPGQPGGSPAAAGQPIETLRPPADMGENRVDQDKAFRAMKAGNWAEATKLFAKLSAAQPDVTEYRLNYAECLYNTPGKLNEARDIYERILAIDGDNILALKSIARIFVKSAQMEKDAGKKTEALEQARDALRRAARNGLNSLRALRNTPEFATDFKDDVQLKLDTIKEPQAFRLDSPGPRDPFFNPLPTKLDTAGGGTAEPINVPGGGLTPAEQDNLVKRLEVLFQDIDPLVAKNDFEGLGKKWAEIDEILRQEKKITSIDLAPKFKDLMKRHREKLPVIKSLLLRSYYTDGERMIEQMKAVYDQQDYKRVFELGERLQAHAKKMVSTDEQFTQPAQDLLAQAKPVLDNAQKLQEIEQIKLNISAIITGGGVSQGIVNNRIISEGDVVYDQTGNPIADLRVLQIKKRRIRFQYKGLEFEPRNQLAVR